MTISLKVLGEFCYRLKCLASLALTLRHTVRLNTVAGFIPGRTDSEVWYGILGFNVPLDTV